MTFFSGVVIRNTYEVLQSARRSKIFLIILLSIPALAACGRREGATPYLPPTLAPTLPVSLQADEVALNSATEAAVVEQPEASPTPACTPDLTFLKDLSIPDGTLVTPGDLLDKSWQVENSGSCNWDKDYRVKLTSGHEMGVATEQALYPARSGTRAVIRMLFTAPDEPGAYRSAWQAHDPSGQPFGDLFFIEILVQESR